MNREKMAPHQSISGDACWKTFLNIFFLLLLLFFLPTLCFLKKKEESLSFTLFLPTPLFFEKKKKERSDAKIISQKEDGKYFIFLLKNREI